MSGSWCLTTLTLREAHDGVQQLALSHPPSTHSFQELSCSAPHWSPHVSHRVKQHACWLQPEGPQRCSSPLVSWSESHWCLPEPSPNWPVRPWNVGLGRLLFWPNIHAESERIQSQASLDARAGWCTAASSRSCCFYRGVVSQHYSNLSESRCIIIFVKRWKSGVDLS